MYLLPKVIILCAMDLFLFSRPGSANAQTPVPATNNSTSVALTSNQASTLEKLWESPGNTVVGVVQGVNITKDDLLKDMWLQNAPAALDELLRQRAVKCAAESAGVKITTDDFQAKANEDIKRTHSSNLNEMLQHHNTTPAHYQRICEGNMLLEAYIRQSIMTIDAKDYADWVKVRYIYIADAGYNSIPAKKEQTSIETKKKQIKSSRKSGTELILQSWRMNLPTPRKM